MRHRRLVPVALLLSLASAHAEDLMISSLAMRARTVVYDLSGVPHEQVQMLAGALRQKFPQAAVFDPAAANDNELREKLKKTFILVTLLRPESRLLPLVAEPLPLKLESGTLRWEDLRPPHEISASISSAGIRMEPGIRLCSPSAR